MRASSSRTLRRLRDELGIASGDPGGSGTLAAVTRLASSRYADADLGLAILPPGDDDAGPRGPLRALSAEVLARVRDEGANGPLDVVLLFAVLGLVTTRALRIVDLPPDEADRLFALISGMASRA